MKPNFFIILLLVLLFCPFFIFAECKNNSATVIFVNGIFGDKEYAEKDKKGLEYEYRSKGVSDGVNFLLGYNASHGSGALDIVEVAVQMYKGGYLDNDLTDILRQLHGDLKTQKVLLVGHSQGTFYTNAAYDYLVNHGVDKNSIAVYNVGTPADRVAGDGKYLTSSTDKIIDSIARKLATLAEAKKPLPANINIEIPNEEGVDYKSGHSFSQAYLGLVPDKIIGDMDQELGALTANNEKNECFIQPEINIMYRVFSEGYQIADNFSKYSNYAATSPYIPTQMVYIANTLFQELYNFGSGIVSNVAEAIESGKSFAASLSASLAQNNNPNLPSNPASSPIVDSSVPQVQTADEEIIITPDEAPSFQDQLDDIQERLDIIKQLTQEIIGQQDQKTQPEVAEVIKIPEDEEDSNDNNSEKNKISISNGGAGGSYTSYPKILVSEVQIDETQEFVELYNPNSEDVPLDGWYLQRKTAGASDWQTFASSNLFAGKIISKNGYFLIARSGHYTGSAHVFVESSITKDNSFALKNPNRDISDKLGIGSAKDPEVAAIDNPVTEQSVGRKVLADFTEQDTDNNSADFEADAPTPGTQNIKYIVPPVVELNSIAITTPATKLAYNVGEDLDIAGLVVTGTYDDGSTKVELLSFANIIGFDGTKAVASQILTININDKIATYEISINEVIDIIPPDIIIYTISNQTISPNGDNIKDTTSIDLAFSEDVKVDLDIVDSSDMKVRDIYNSSKVKNPDAKIWDGKDNSEKIVTDGVYTVKIVITDMAGNSITDKSKIVAVDTIIPSSTNFVITPGCVFSSPDLLNAYGSYLGAINMCSCSSFDTSDNIKKYGIDIKTGCRWTSSTNMVCRDVTSWKNGDSKKWTYPTIYIINGICSLNPVLPNPIPSSDATVISKEYVVSTLSRGVGTINNLQFNTPKESFLSNLTKNEINQTWDTSAISSPVKTGDILLVTAEDGVTKVTYNISAPSSDNFTISPSCIFSSSDISNVYGNTLGVVEMCGCGVSESSDAIKFFGIDMKTNCRWDASTSRTCRDVTFRRNGDSKKWTYPTIYIIDGVCSTSPSLTPIDIHEVAIRAPFIRATPAQTAVETSEYTSTISWIPNDVSFVADTFYTAKITIIPKTKYSLQGVTENFFTVAGSSSPATNDANSGIITATFPSTAKIETTIPSTNFAVTPDCLFSSTDVSKAYGNVWGIAGMCSCTSPGWSDDIKTKGIDMKTNCRWNSSTNLVCKDVASWQNGSINKWVYPTVYIINGVCGTVPPLSSDATIASTVYAVGAVVSGAGSITGIPAVTSKSEFLSNLTKNEINQTWDTSAILDPVVTGNTLVITAEDNVTKITYTVTVNEPVVSATQLKIISLPQSFLVGAPSAVFTIESQNSEGILTKVLSTTYINLSSDSPTGLFSGSSADGPCDEDWTKTSITIAKNTAHKSFCYKDITFGTYSIKVSADGLSSDSQSVVINP